MYLNSFYFWGKLKNFNKMKRILSILSIFCLFVILGCDRSSDTPTTTPVPTPITKDEAVINITVTGRQSFENIKIQLYEGNDSRAEKTLTQDGKANFDVSSFIGKSLIIKVVETVNGADKVLAYKNYKIEKNSTYDISLSIPAKDFATINVSATGRDSYDNITIYAYTSSTVAMGYKTLSKDGKASFDVSEYIGKTITLKAVEKDGTATISHPNEVSVVVEKNKEHNVSISIPKKKEYNATITVIKDGKPLANTKVYALNLLEYPVKKISIPLTGSEALKDILNVTTNANGQAAFKAIPATELLKKYYFVVITQESNLQQSHQGMFYETVLELDGTEQTGKIEFKSTPLLVNIVSNKNLSNTKVHLYRLPPNLTYSKPIYTTSISNKVAKFDDISSGAYYLYTTTDGECLGTAELVKINVEKEIENKANLSLYSGGLLKLTNKSSNPYTVKVTDVKGTVQTFVMQGNSVKDVGVEEVGKVTISVKQNSGYILYPTEESFSKTMSCGGTVSQCFPSDRCQ